MDGNTLLARLRTAATPGAPPDRRLLPDLATVTDLPTLVEAGRLLAAVPAGRLTPVYGTTRPLRVAITGTFTAPGVAPLLRLALLQAGIDPEIHVSGFDQLQFDLTDPDSDLARFAPDVTLCLVHDGWFVPPGWDPVDLPALADSISERRERFDSMIGGFTSRTDCAVLIHTVHLSATEYRSVVSFDGRAALGRIWREFNVELLRMADRHEQVHVLDLEALLTCHEIQARDERTYRFASAAWSSALERRYAGEAANFCRARLGAARKCLVLDLDNTLWGGTIGDDGLSGIQLGTLYPGNCYTELQRRVLALRQQGVILALCSKNDEVLVDKAFAEHPDMLVGPADVAARRVNWEPKDRNLVALADELNIDVGSLVFADDSAFECELVRGALPLVEVVHLAGDPADHATRLLRDGSFDVLTTTADDLRRTERYRARAGREREAAAFGSLEDYLASLEITVTIRAADEFSLPRLTQLAGRTNQFTMTGTPHSARRTTEMAASADSLVLAFQVADRIGDEGLVGGVWISTHGDHWLVENLVMSCRVFSRGIEHAVLQHVADSAAAAGATRLAADFRATGRNGPASRCYPGAHFQPEATGPEGTVRYTLALAPRPLLCPEWIQVRVDG